MARFIVAEDEIPVSRALADDGCQGRLVNVESEAAWLTVKTRCVPPSTTIASVACGSSWLKGTATNLSAAGKRMARGNASVAAPNFGTIPNR